MNKTLLALIISSTGMMSQANATHLVPISTVSNTADVSFKFSIQNKLNLDSNTYISDEAVNMQVTINIQTKDVGQRGGLYLIAKYDDSWFQFTAAGEWIAWFPDSSELLPFNSKILAQSEVINIVNKQTLPAGEFLVYSGYQTELDQQLYYNSSASSFVVFDKNTTALHKVKNTQLLTGLFTQGSQQRNHFATVSFSDFSPAPPALPSTSAVSSDVATSQTNLQETGVDESDRIKTTGNQLYTLERCDTDSNKECISSYQISSNPTTNNRLGQLGKNINLGNQGSLYLAEIKGTKHLIHQSNSHNFGIANTWFAPYYWQDNNTEIRFIDISKPSQMSASTYISLDSAIISSRLVDGVLYLVTRKNPYFDPPVAIDLLPPPIIDDTQPAPEPNEEPVIQKEPDINDLLPLISFEEGEEGTPIVEATDCFIPNRNSSKFSDNTLIAVTAIPLDNPKSYYSTCIAGNIDTFYMSTKSLYLASSQYPSTLSGNTLFYQPGDAEMRTEIHKFALTKNSLDYRGSVDVEGHLGWDADKQPFRMGEHADVLKVATSKGNAWDKSSSTSVSVLRESPDTQSLEEISSLHNLGKPGEKLYAARFIGARGYLVTFKKVDPLYVLDFKNPEQPEIVGELEINGYSDYLHPIGENYLLGIGKDAITEAGNEFAWYQGVKLSLFDVSDGQNLREIKSIIIGKRGTESAILHDHHALAWLPSETDNSATLAIPIQLNDRTSNRSNQDFNQLNAYYDWTHTGLYTFNISTDAAPDIELLGKLITDQPPEICIEPGNSCYLQGQQTHNDRAVIQGNGVHYIHNNEVFSSAIADLE